MVPMCVNVNLISVFKNNYIGLYQNVLVSIREFVLSLIMNCIRRIHFFFQVSWKLNVPFWWSLVSVGSWLVIHFFFKFHETWTYHFDEVFILLDPDVTLSMLSPKTKTTDHRPVVRLQIGSIQVLCFVQEGRTHFADLNFHWIFVGLRNLKFANTFF